MTAFPDVPPGVDPTRPTPARLYNYFLDGTLSFPADREVAERLKATVPDVVDGMLANRGFHGRAATWIARQGVRRLIDLTRPAGVLMTTLPGLVPDEDDPWGLVARYMEAVAPGSYLALSHGTYDKIPPNMVLAGRAALANVAGRVHLRSKAEVERFFDGLELVPPYTGADRVMTYAGLWGAEDIEAADTEGSRGIYCGVARRP